MIKRLRLRMSLLVIGVLIVVSVGIVLAIYEMNNRSIITQAESALEALAENSGARPSLPEIDPGAGRTPPEGEGPGSGSADGETPPPKPEGETDAGSPGNQPPPAKSEEESSGAQSPPEKPDEASNGEPTSSEKSDAASDETQPGKPEAESSGGQTPPEKPEGDTGGNQTPPERPEGESSGDQAPPARPEGESSGDQTPPEKPEGDQTPPPSRGGNPPGGDPGSRRTMTREEVASLSNYYTMTLDENGQIQSWESDRADLYNEETLQFFADRVWDSGLSSGQFDTQFFRLVSQTDGTFLLIVLDARLEMSAGWQVLKTAALVAGIACLALSFGAWLLIRRMVRPVEEAFTKQQQFVWDASHELKTPLAVISANADVLEAEIGENEYLEYIQSEVHRTDSLVKNLLTLARMDRGTADQEMREMNLSEAVLGVLLPFESTVFEAGKTLESEIQEEVHVTGNEAMLQQLTVILLSNALKYSDEHGILSVRLEKKGRGAELRVENTGKGIAAKDLTRIFDRFYRTDASRNSETGGEGLGLAIAKSIVEIHHGKIRAESVEGKNAVFIVTLP